MPMMPNGGMTPGSPMPEMPGMPSHSTMPGMPGMSGMMSEQDMQALQNAHGVDASKRFLSQMIQHHQGAITMVQDEIKSADRRPVGAPWFAKIRRWSPVVLASGAAGSLPVFVVVVPGKTLVL